MRLFVVLSTIAFADALPKDCAPLSGEASAEVARLLKSAGEHASMFRMCQDGDDEVVTLQLSSACLANAQIVVRYAVRKELRPGGECSPYPECANPPPPESSKQSVSLALSGGLLVVPKKLPGVTLRTALDKTHRAGCSGTKAAFVPRKIAP